MRLFNTYRAAVVSEEKTKTNQPTTTKKPTFILNIKSFRIPGFAMELIIQFCWSATIRSTCAEVLFAAAICSLLSTVACLLKVRSETIVRLKAWWPVLAIIMAWSHVWWDIVLHGREIWTRRTHLAASQLFACVADLWLFFFLFLLVLIY